MQRTLISVLFRPACNMLRQLDSRLRGNDGLFAFIVIPAAAGIQSIQKTHYIS